MARGGESELGAELACWAWLATKIVARKAALRDLWSPHRRSSAALSHFAASAAAAYALSKKSITAFSGEASASTASYLKMNSPNALSHPALAGRTFASANPSGTGAA